MKNILIIGSSGYFSEIFIKKYINKYKIIGVDIQRQIIFHKKYSHYQFDARDYSKLSQLVKKYSIRIIINFATLLDFAIKNQKDLYTNNVELAKNIKNVSNDLNVKKIIFTSSNSIFVGCKETLITDKTTPKPIDMYGLSKLKSEEIFHDDKNKFSSITFRVPNILDEKRIGMISILFELLINHNVLWVVDNGKIKHQCIYANDLATAIHSSLNLKESYKINLGSKNVPTFMKLFSKMKIHAKSRSRILSINKKFVIFCLKILYLLKLSPFGGYQIRMLTKNFLFDNRKARKLLKWDPKVNNYEAMVKAFDYYKDIKLNKKIFKNSSFNSQPIKMGILKILMYIK
jgi:UDP-glucose 4-epimerase